jgi:2'-5' RNA ligase
VDTSASVCNHWQPLEGWEGDRRLLACYLTVEGQGALHDLVDAYQNVLRDRPELDLIQRRWLHVTVLGISFMDTIDQAEVADIVATMREVAGAVPPIHLSAGKAVIHRDAIQLPLEPTDALSRLRAGMKSALRQRSGTRPLYLLPGQSDRAAFSPHLSIAYANSTAAAAPLLARLGGVDRSPVPWVISKLSVIALARSERTWRWDDISSIPLGTGEQARLDQLAHAGSPG